MEADGWGNAFLIHFARCFFSSLFCFHPLLLRNSRLFFIVVRMLFSISLTLILSSWFAFVTMCFQSHLFNLQCVESGLHRMAHTLFSCYKFNVDYVYRAVVIKRQRNALILSYNSMTLFFRSRFTCVCVCFGFVSTCAHYENNPEKLQAVISFGMLTVNVHPNPTSTHRRIKKKCFCSQNKQPKKKKKNEIVSSHDCCTTLHHTAFFYSFVHSFVQLTLAVQTKVSTSLSVTAAQKNPNHTMNT